MLRLLGRFRRCVWKGESQHRQCHGDEPSTQPLQATCGRPPSNSIGFPECKHGSNTQQRRDCHPYPLALLAAVVTGRLLGRRCTWTRRDPLAVLGRPHVGPLHGHRHFEPGCDIRCWNGCLQRAQGCWRRSVPCPFHVPTRHEGAFLHRTTLKETPHTQQKHPYSHSHAASKPMATAI